MSADNWTVCPRCEALASETAKRFADEAAAAYGKVKPAEYEHLFQKALTTILLPDTLHEDYEIGIDKGVFSVSYHAECDCGFKHVFRMNNTKVT